MNKRGLLTFALVASLVLNVTLLATAGYRYYQRTSSWVSPFGVRMPKDRFLFDELPLRPEQRKAMKARAVPFREEITRRRSGIIAARRELISLMRQDTTDKAKIDAVILRISATQAEMQRRITSHMLEEKSLLDPDQQRAFLDLIEQRMTSGMTAGCPPGEQN